MSSISFFYKNPLTWLILLMVLQIYVAFKLEPAVGQSASELEAYEKVLVLTENTPEVARFIESQNDNLARKNAVISALLDVLRYFGSFIAFFALIFLVLLYRRQKKQ